MKIKLLFVSFIMVVLSSVSVSADDKSDFRRGFDAYNKGDYATALKEWKPLAKSGFIHAQYNLGLMYYLGQGVRRDVRNAYEWWSLAAEKGHLSAQDGLGNIYKSGRAVPRDYKKAVELYSLAAQQGRPISQYHLGEMYAKGFGVEKNNIIAHMWISISEAADFVAGITSEKLEKEMSPEQIAEAEILADECVKKEYKGC
jgi:uncharacterized protein